MQRKHKPLLPEDVKSEDIASEIEKSLYGKDNSRNNAASKLLTFFMLFLFYLYLSIKVTNPLAKITIIIFGLVFLIFILQDIVLPSLRQKKKRQISEP